MGTSESVNTDPVGTCERSNTSSRFHTAVYMGIDKWDLGVKGKFREVHFFRSSKKSLLSCCCVLYIYSVRIIRSKISLST